MVTYGKALKKWREDQGLTQAAAAVKITVTQGCWGSWEADRTLPDVGNALAIHDLTKGAVPATLAKKPRRGPTRTRGRRTAGSVRRTGTDG